MMMISWDMSAPAKMDTQAEIVKLVRIGCFQDSFIFCLIWKTCLTLKTIYTCNNVYDVVHQDTMFTNNGSLTVQRKIDRQIGLIQASWNPPTPAKVKVNQNVDILAAVYLVHIKVKHCQTLRVVSTFTGQNEATVFDWEKHYLVLLRVDKMTVKTSQNAHVCTVGSTVAVSWLVLTTVATCDRTSAIVGGLRNYRPNDELSSEAAALSVSKIQCTTK